MTGSDCTNERETQISHWHTALAERENSPQSAIKHWLSTAPRAGSGEAYRSRTAVSSLTWSPRLTSADDIQGHPVRFSMLRWIWYTKTHICIAGLLLIVTYNVLGEDTCLAGIVETNPSAHKTSTWLNLYSMLNSTSSTGNQYDINLGL